MSTIKIGRSPYGKQKLEITSGKVSREHAILTQLSKNSWKIQDVGSTGGTYVNGMAIVEATVGIDTPIFLADFRTSVWELLSGKTRPSVSIGHLEKVYNDYQNALIEIAQKRNKQQIKRMLPMQLIMPVILGLSCLLPTDKPWSIAAKGIAMCAAMLLYGYYSIRTIGKTDKHVEEQFEINQQFQIDYVCPKCGTFFGASKPYEALVRQGRCLNHNCKSIFIESER